MGREWLGCIRTVDRLNSKCHSIILRSPSTERSSLNRQYWNTPLRSYLYYPRHEQHKKNRHSCQQMTQSGGGTPQHDGCDPGQQQKDRNFGDDFKTCCEKVLRYLRERCCHDYLPSCLAFLISSESRLISSAESCVSFISISAAAASAAEPLKNVFTICCSAERRACFASTVGR